MSPEKKKQVRKSQIRQAKFAAVACPLLLLYSVPLWLKANLEIPVYHHDCLEAQTVTKSLPDSVPCYDEVATARLENYYKRGVMHDHQDVQLYFQNGRTASMEIDADAPYLSKWWKREQVDGQCSAETWHGKIVAIVKPGVRLLSQENPELKGGTTFAGINAAIITLTLGVWSCLFVLWRRGDLKSDTGTMS